MSEIQKFPNISSRFEDTHAISLEGIRDCLIFSGSGVDIMKSRVLEIGIGRGELLKEMKDAGIDAVGIDAKPRTETNKSVITARAEKLPFADKTFDVVISEAAFDHHLYNQNQGEMYAEIHRVLRPNGVYFPNEVSGASEIPGFESIGGSTGPGTVYRKI